MKLFEGRSTGEILVLIISITVCGYVMVVGLVTIILVFIHPEIDLSKVAGNISDIINTLIGLLAGFLAGKSDVFIKPKPGKSDGGPS